MSTSGLRPKRTLSSTVWTLRAGRETYRVRTASARTALRHARLQGARDPVIVGLDLDPEIAKSSAPHVPETRFDRLRRALLPDAIRRRDAGESITDIAASLKVPRETLRDWLLAAGV